MSLVHSPSIVTNGLLFYYDQNNIKSYKGPSTQNLANNIGISGTGTATGYSSVGTTEVVNVPQVGQITSYRNTIQNNYTVYTPNSGNCCPSLHGWGNITVTPSTLYTYLILYKCDSGYTGPNYMYRYEYVSNGGAYVTEGGVHSEANRVHLGSNWYYAWGTFTTQATTTWLGQCGTFYYRYSNVPDNLSVAKVAIIPGNYSGMHPKYWPNTATTRSNTQAILDLTNNNTITANSLTYASDGSFSFVPANSNRLSVPLATAFNKLEGTINLWVYPQGYNGGNGYFVNKDDSTANALDWFWIGPYSNTFYFRLGDGTYCCNNDLTLSNYSSVVPLNVWSNICVTWGSGQSSYLYINSLLKASRTISVIPNTNPSTNGTFGLGHASGDSYFNGKIPLAQIYNRVLSVNEISQNFNATRRKYGI